ncbi:PepSY domain-containing protein [Dermatobacter hominis]|uniref:PepSY domain-containing protein n=1 Tax=Dermatobacter hominis TaxID=2884263 RepID=UPI001D0F7762|nr:PepSY domain-containing protein [Dermatobacter hominis]UDY37652.1 PepSY domain-containing protein [Dermatobacter hominis]
MRPLRKKLGTAALGGALLLGGAGGAYALTGTAGAQDTTTTTAPSGSTQQPADGQQRGPHTANGITETPLTGTELEKATAAALGAVPGATVERAETDADGATYEVHATKADGSHVTVALDADFNVTGTQAGR